MSKDVSQVLSCGHCSNISGMEIVGTVFDLIKRLDYKNDPNFYGPPMDEGTYYSVLKCPACKKINIVSYYWAEWWQDSEDEIEYDYTILYPQTKNLPIGLPQNILKTYEAAEKIKTIDVNAYVILLRRLLELVCLDRKAVGDTLALMLQDLANRSEIPSKLVSIAKRLKDFGNIGAHAGIGELSEKEIPIVSALCNAILEYIYSAPYLASEAEAKLKAIKKPKNKV